MNTATANRIIEGVRAQWVNAETGMFTRPTLGQSVFLRYSPTVQNGQVQAYTERPDCNPSNIAEGVVTKAWSPDNNSLFWLTVEITNDFPTGA